MRKGVRLGMPNCELWELYPRNTTPRRTDEDLPSKSAPAPVATPTRYCVAGPERKEGRKKDRMKEGKGREATITEDRRIVSKEIAGGDTKSPGLWPSKVQFQHFLHAYTQESEQKTSAKCPARPQDLQDKHVPEAH